MFTYSNILNTWKFFIRVDSQFFGSESDEKVDSTTAMSLLLFCSLSFSLTLDTKDPMFICVITWIFDITYL